MRKQQKQKPALLDRQQKSITQVKLKNSLLCEKLKTTHIEKLTEMIHCFDNRIADRLKNPGKSSMKQNFIFVNNQR